MLDLIVKNGTVVNADAVMVCDIGVKNGKIIEMGDSTLWGDAKKVIDASGKYVMPGMLDSHIHIASPGPFPSQLTVERLVLLISPFSVKEKRQEWL